MAFTPEDLRAAESETQGWLQFETGELILDVETRDRVIERMLAKDPERRHSVPAEVGTALIPFCSGAELLALLRKAGHTPQPETHLASPETNIPSKRTNRYNIPIVSMLVTSLSSGRLFHNDPIIPESNNKAKIALKIP